MSGAFFLQFSRALRSGSCLCAKKGNPGAVRVGSKLGAGASPSGANIDLPKDASSLSKYCIGSQVYKDQPDPEILPDSSSYPDWLWSIRTNGPPLLEELDPNTLEYWNTLIEMTYQQVKIDRVKPKHRKLKEF